MLPANAKLASQDEQTSKLPEKPETTWAAPPYPTATPAKAGQPLTDKQIAFATYYLVPASATQSVATAPAITLWFGPRKEIPAQFYGGGEVGNSHVPDVEGKHTKLIYCFWSGAVFDLP